MRKLRSMNKNKVTSVTKVEEVSMDPQVPDPQEPMDTMCNLETSEIPVPMECTIDSDNGDQKNLKIEFPVVKFEEIYNSQPTVPLLPDGELECLLTASIKLCKIGTAEHIEVSQYLFRGLVILLTKTLTNEASWESITQNSIKLNCEKMIELCVLNLHQDWLCLLDALAVVFDPNNKFNTVNISKVSESVPFVLDVPEKEFYALPCGSTAPRGWLVDLINRFGSLRGFEILLERFKNTNNLTVPLIHSLIRPFGLCIGLLTINTLDTYFFPIVRITIDILNNLIDDELKNEEESDKIMAIMAVSETLMTKIDHESEMIRELNTLRMTIILKILQISSFNGKMSALHEINEIIVNIKLLRNSTKEKRDCITAEYIIQWIKENGVLEIVLKDSLDQPEYVEQLETILEFMIEECAFTLEDLDEVWAAQDGQDEAIMKNVHHLLATLAWDICSEQLDHLFECFETSLKATDNEQRQKLMELMKRLAEEDDDDKGGIMTDKVLLLLWDFAHWDEVSTEIMDQALNFHVKILEAQNDEQRLYWLDKCVGEIPDDDWALQALKQIQEICLLYEDKSNFGYIQNDNDFVDRQEVVKRTEELHSICFYVIENLSDYMGKVFDIVEGTDNIDPNVFMPDNRHSHVWQVQERLNFLHFIMKNGQYSLMGHEASTIWKCLAEEGIYESDRETCFEWFFEPMGENSHLNPEEYKEFFEDRVLQLDPSLLTESGMKCFEKLFKAVNIKQGKMTMKEETFVVKDVNLIGIDYLWTVVRNSPEKIANRATEFLKQVYTTRKVQKNLRSSYQWNHKF